MELEIVNKHALFRERDGYVLVDTGSPVTVERKAQSISDMLGGLMAGLGMDENLQQRVLGQLGSERGQAIAEGLGLSDEKPLVDLAEVSKKVGKDVVKLLGTDKLSEGPVLIDYPNGRIEFNSSETLDDACELPCRILAGIPVVTIKVAGEDRQLFLDTGAPTNYISSGITAGMTPAGTINDFHPQAGEFNVPIFELETEIADFKGKIDYGNLPSALAQYEQVGCEGIIGYDLFSRFSVLLDICKYNFPN